MSRKFTLTAAIFVLLLVSVYSSLFTFVMSDKPKTAELCLQRRDENNNAIALCCQTDLQVNGIPVIPKDLGKLLLHVSDCKRCDASGKCVSSGKPSNKQVLGDSNITKFNKKNIIKDLDLAAKLGTTNSSNNTGVMKGGAVLKDGILKDNNTSTNSTYTKSNAEKGYIGDPSTWCKIGSGEGPITCTCHGGTDCLHCDVYTGLKCKDISTRLPSIK